MTLTSMTLSSIPWDLVLEVLGFCVGLLYLWWEYRADRRLWYASVVMPMISMWIYFSKGLYADFSINIYYLAIAVYGFRKWSRGDGGKEKSSEKGKDKESLPITSIPARQLAGCVCGALILWGVLYLILRYLTDSTVPVADAFTTALSIVGMWMLARKYLEQWIVWILVDFVCVGLYIYKGIYLYATLYGIYTVIAVFGYRRWKREMGIGLRKHEES